MIKKSAASCLLLLAIWAAAGQTVTPGVSAQLANFRHRVISRVNYTMSFNLPPERTATILATETIRFSLSDASQDLQLDFRQDSSHVLELRINGHPAAIHVLSEHLVLDYRLLVKGTNTISIRFVAGDESLNRNNDYLYALFVPDRARTVFPCFDQPDLKATFRLSLTAPSDWAVLANGSIEDSLTTGRETVYHFRETEPLPTYLFSFTAGRYAIANRFGMRLLYRETDTAKIRLSVDSVFLAHRAAIAFLEQWTGIPFPFQKIGFVAIPSFQFGGMEHPGEVQYNAGALFLDEAATRDQQIARTAVISHETAHMWFGDMVTMAWFNDVWMKEVFANFMADKVTEKLLGHETFILKFLLDHTPAAYSIDRTAGANPIRQRLDNLSDAGSLYGSIIYHKAPIMMRQLESLMGKENFRQGVRAYLHKYKYGNARWNDLISLLSAHTPADLVSWNNVWVNRPGRPVFSSQYANGNLSITQQPEQGAPAIWPQQFMLTVGYPGRSVKMTVNSRSQTTVIPLAEKPQYLVFNSDGSGYGLFPAYNGQEVFSWPDPVQRAATYINRYENMLAGKGPPPLELLEQFEEGFDHETNELNLRLICSYAGTIYWNQLTGAERSTAGPNLEKRLWNSVSSQLTANNKKIIFRTYQDVCQSAESLERLYRIWKQQLPPDSIRLTEDDYTALAITIALKNDTAATVLSTQLNRIKNPDRRARLEFLVPSLSPDTTVRDAFFLSLSDPGKRHKEAWVAAALAYMNHPLRQQAFVKFLPAALDMLQDVQRTGDVFFPQNWLNAVFPQYSSAAAWEVVNKFLAAHPGYNPKLREKILQAADNVYRAQQIRHVQPVK